MIGIFRFQDLERWDWFTVPRLPANNLWASRLIGDLMEQRQEKVDLAVTPFDTLQPISISFGGYVKRRPVAAGRRYTMSMLRAYAGDIVLSKIDLKNGAVGVLPDEVGDAVVTTHFAVYKAKSDLLDPLYFRHLVQTSPFKRWLKTARSGTDGRTEVKLDLFEALAIPLPDLETQCQLVASLEAALIVADELEQKGGRIEAQALTAFAADLGLGAPPPLPDRPIFIANFTAFDRWSHEAVLRRISGTEAPPSPWPMVTLGDVIMDLENGWSPQCLDGPAKDGDWGVLKVSAVSSGTYRQNANKALPQELAPRPHLAVKGGDVLIARASGAADRVGVASFVSETRDRLMICDKIFRVVPHPDELVLPVFLASVLNVPFVRQQIRGEFSTQSAMMKNVTKPALMGLAFPLPSDILEQRRMVEALGRAREDVAVLRQQAVEQRRNARRRFEQAIYGELVSGPSMVEGAEGEADLDASDAADAEPLDEVVELDA